MPFEPVIMSSGTLRQWLAAYCLSRDLSKSYRQQLAITVDSFERFAGQVPLEALTDDTVNNWLVHLAGCVGSKETVKTQRRNLLVLWRDAYAAGKAPRPDRVRVIKCPRKMPEAWSVPQMVQLLEAARHVEGRFLRSMVPRAAFWRATILTTWDSALRLGDLLTIPTVDIENIPPDGTIWVVQAKTGYPVRCRLWPETIAAILATFPPERDFVFGGVLTRWHIFDQFKQLATSAGLKGGTRKIRKSSGTDIEREHPGGAMKHLGHQSQGIAEKHYIDRRLIAEDKPMPARIGLCVSA